MWIFKQRHNILSTSSRKFNMLFASHFSNYAFRVSYINHVFVHLCRPSQIQKLDSMTSLCTLSQRYLHTAKKWKVIANPKLAENELSPGEVGCEEGSTAVPHNVLLSALNSCNTVGEQLHALSDTLALTAKDESNRNEFRDYLVEILKPYFTSFQIHKFGSSSNTLGFKGSDIDICIQTNFDETEPPEFGQLKEVPNPEDVLEGRVDRALVSNMYPKLLLRFIRRVLRQNCKDTREPIFLIKGRCPILRLYNEKYDLFCDFSCENKSAIKNTKLIRFISHLDNRFPIIARALRYWGKHGKFVGDIEQFNSYAFSLLVVYFLQNTNPPVVPPLNYLITKSEYLQYGDIGDDDLLRRSVEAFSKSLNTQSTEELFRDFFFFYTFYDFRQVMLPLTSFTVAVKEFQSDEDPPTDTFEVGTVCIQDPFRRSFNSTSGVAYRHGRKFLSSLVEACQVYQHYKFMVPSPKQENWGLSTVLDSTADVHDNLIHNQKEMSFLVPLSPYLSQYEHDMEQKLFSKVCSFIKDIFEYGLLFKVSVYHDQTSRFTCEVLQRTWVGRQSIYRQMFLDETSANLLDNERKISMNIVKDEEKGPVMFRFSCQCSLTEEDAGPHVKVKLNFTSGKCSSAVHIFFKDYISKMLKRLL